jgi:hypothetical protein
MFGSFATDLVQSVCSAVTLKVKDEPLFDRPDHGYNRIESVFDLGIEIQNRLELFWCCIE